MRFRVPVLYAEGNWHFEAENLVPNQILVVGEVWWNVAISNDWCCASGSHLAYRWCNLANDG